METDALTRRPNASSVRENPAEPKDRRQVASRADVLFIHMAKDCWNKEAKNGSGPNNKGKKVKGKDKEKNSVNEVTDSHGVSDDCTSGNLSQSKLENHLGHRHLGSSPPHG